MLLQIADDFIESVVTAACQLARHRKSNTLEVKDVQLHLGEGLEYTVPSGLSAFLKINKKKKKTFILMHPFTINLMFFMNFLTIIVILYKIKVQQTLCIL